MLAELKRGEDGAALVFEGVVRNQTRGRRTLYLDYEAYEGMALQQMESLAAQALEKFQIRREAGGAEISVRLSGLTRAATGTATNP